MAVFRLVFHLFLASVFLNSANGVHGNGNFELPDLMQVHPRIIEDEYHVDESTPRRRESDDYDTTIRLPTSLTAIDYYFQIKPYFPAPGVVIPDVRNLTFDGSSIAHLSVVSNTNVFVVNAYSLNFTSVAVSDSNKNPITVSSYSYNETSEQLTIVPATTPVVGQEYFLSFSYTGLILDYRNSGVFYTYDDNVNGTRIIMISTQMQSFSARSVFPCLDEPSYKATFNASLIYPTSLVAVANMPSTKVVQLDNGWSQADFRTTMKMSTYLVAFGVGPYVKATYTNKFGVEVNAWSFPGQEEFLPFVAETSGKCLESMATYTGIPYPFEKNDQLGVANNVFNGMENWGLVIYKWSTIGYNPKTMTTHQKETIIKEMCHENQHQWFGNLVTMAWWDDLWLNEGMGNYFQRYAQNYFLPNTDDYLEAILIAEDREYALGRDAITRTHPMSPTDGPYYDDITYNKGTSIMRMMSDTIGADVFRKGLQNYLNAHAYGNVVHEDLFTELTKVAQEAGIRDWCGNLLNVSDWMQPYVYQVDLPIINWQSDDSGIGRLSQEPFSDPSIYNRPSQYNYSWAIPLQTKTFADNTTTLRWVMMDYESCLFNNREDNRVRYEVAAIAGATYARIRYDDRAFNRILEQIPKGGVPRQSLLALLNDEIALLQRDADNGNAFSYYRILNLLRATLKSPDYVSTPAYYFYDVSQDQMEFFSSLYRDSIDATFINMMYSDFMGSAYNTMTWNTTNSWDIDSFAEDFLPYAVRYSVGDAPSRAMDLYAQFRSQCIYFWDGTQNCNPIHPDFRRAMYCAAVKYDNASNFGDIMQFYKAEVLNSNPYFPQEYLALLEGLTCTEKSAEMQTLIKYFLTSTISSSKIFGWLNTNPLASDSLYNYLLQRPDDVLSYSGLSSYLNSMVYNWRTESRYKQYDTMINQLAAQGKLTTARNQTLQTYRNQLRDQIDWANKHTPLITKWMYDNFVVIGRNPWSKRLESPVQPLNYKLTVQPYIPAAQKYPFYKNLTFDATSSFTFYNVKKTTTLSVNSHRMHIIPDDIRITDSSNTTIDIDTKLTTKDYDNGILTIVTKQELTVAVQYTITFKYVGFVFNDPSDGVDSNVNYYEFDSQTGWIFTTDFEGGPSTRSLIPCIDEPAYKAPFEITVIHSPEMTALSNAMHSSISVANGQAISAFKATPPMSSYLLAIAVGHFSSVNTMSDSGILVRLFSWTGMERYGDFGLKVISNTVDFMSEYFDYPFKLEKLDTLALPQYSGGSGGAMENWGLIIGRYNEFLVDPDYATVDDYTRAAETSAHETVHQWFGDLVTMDWWNDLFLNEGFAQYWYMQGINRAFPEQFDYAINYNQYDTTSYALSIDCSSNTQPVITNNLPLFSGIKYYKGSSLLKMLSNVLSPATLQKGLRSYIVNFAFSNADANDLWTYLTQAAAADGVKDWNNDSLDVSVFMNEWTLQKSFPVLVLNNNANAISYSQQSCISQTVQWKIPLQVADENGESLQWFTGTNGNGNTWNHPIHSPFRVDNAREMTMTRVQYDEASFYNIVNQLLSDPTAFSPYTRASIISDTIYFVDAGVYPWSRFLNLTMYLPLETEYAPWSEAIPRLSSIVNHFTFTSNFAIVKDYIETVTANTSSIRWRQTGIWTEDSLSEIVTQFVCIQMDFFDCSTIANGYFEKFAKICQNTNAGTASCTTLAPHLRRTMYCRGLDSDESKKSLVEAHYRYFEYNATYFRRDGDNLLNALTCVFDKDALTTYAARTVKGEFPSAMITHIGENDYTGNVLYAYFMNSTLEVLNGLVPFQVFVNAMTRNWNQQWQLDELTNFVSTAKYKLLNSDERVIWTGAQNTVKANMKWLDDNGSEIMDWIWNVVGASNRQPQVSSNL